MVVPKWLKRHRQKGKKTMKRFTPWGRQLKALVIGHSMVRNAEDRLWQIARAKNLLDGHYGAGMNKVEAYPYSIKLNKRLQEIQLCYTPKPFSQEFDAAVEEAKTLNSDVAVLHVASNDLARSKKSPIQIANGVISAAVKPRKWS